MGDAFVEEKDTKNTPRDGHQDVEELSQEAPEIAEETSPNGAEATETDAAPQVPLQKRRRVTRACDECRRKKIKCDGKQPCTHCTVYSYECTYDQPSNRRRNATPAHIEALEQRLKRAEAIIHAVLPGLDLNDPSIEEKLQNGQLQTPPTVIPNPTPSNIINNVAQPAKGIISHDPPTEAELESMVRTTGQLDLDEQGYWDYHGHSSGLSFVRRMREHLGDIIGPQGQATPFVKSPPVTTSVFESPRSTHMESPSEPSFQSDLPSREMAKELCHNAIDEAAAILRIVHKPTFFKSLDNIYDTLPENYGNEENSFLPLLYSVLALGSLFMNDGPDHKGYESAIDEGLKYFKMSRQLMDIAECRDLQSVQAIVFMILFLQSSAKMSTCYSYVGIALRSALRMGLHRSFPDSFNPIETECRKRTFWVIRKLDTYVGALLGLPHTMNDDDIDQEMPVELDDEYITETGYLPMPEGRISVMAACNAHTRVVAIIQKIVRYIYPLKSARNSNPNREAESYSVSYSKIREIENDLKDWKENLPMALRPGGEASPLIIRVQQLLRMSYAYTQVMLYRPFLHYVSRTCKSKSVDKRSYACAATCVSVSRNVIHITTEMMRRNLLIGAYWFTMYTTFFAILSLVFFALENPDNPTSQEVLRDAYEGKETLTQLAKRSMAADRCSATLETLFDQLPERLKQTSASVLRVPSRKRRQENSQVPPLPVLNQNTVPVPQPRRTNSVPDPIQVINKRSSFPYGGILHTQSPLVQEVPIYHGLRDMVDSSHVTTPSSTNNFQYPTPPPNSQQHPHQQTWPITPTNATFSQSTPQPALPDLTSTMFPSTDPFAYPNQPLTTFDTPTLRSNSFDFPSQQPSSNPTSVGFNNNNTAFPNLPNGGSSTDAALSGDLDMQLFGPMPMYMTQGSQMLQGPRHGPGHVPPIDGTGNSTVNLDELFGGEEWAGMFADYGHWGQQNMGFNG